MGDDNTSEPETKKRQDYHTPWKKVLVAYYKEFVHFFFPDMAKEKELAEFFLDAQSLDEIRARADELRKSGKKDSSD